MIDIILPATHSPETLVPSVLSTLGGFEVQTTGIGEVTGTTTEFEVFPDGSVADTVTVDQEAIGRDPVVSHDHFPVTSAITGRVRHTIGEILIVDHGSAVPVIGFVRLLIEFTFGADGAVVSTVPLHVVAPLLVFPDGSVIVTFNGSAVGTGVIFMLKLPLPFTVPVHTTAPLALVIVTIHPTSQLPVKGLKFDGRLRVGVDGADMSIFPVVIGVFGDSFPASSVCFTFTTHSLGIGFAVILQFPELSTIPVHTTTQPLFVIVMIAHTSHVPVSGLKFVGVFTHGADGAVVST